MSREVLFFTIFLVSIFFILALDLGVFSKKNEGVNFKQAGIMSAVWVSLALLFYLFLRNFGYLIHDIESLDQLKELIVQNKHNVKISADPSLFAESLKLYNINLALEFITGYVVEYALSVDNIFVMVLIFTAFKVEEKQYHRVLFWGIIGAVLLRFLFIFTGATLISKFEWIIYVFGAFLVYTGIAMFISRDKEEEIDTENHPVVKFASKIFAVHPNFVGNKFFVKYDHKTFITPLFIVLLVIEFTDVIFAVDSIPAVFAVTQDAFVAFASNILAILGLRALYFVLADWVTKLRYLKPGLAAILGFIGVKMLLVDFIKIPSWISLIVIFSVLTTAGLSSWYVAKIEGRKKDNIDPIDQ